MKPPLYPRLKTCVSKFADSPIWPYIQISNIFFHACVNIGTSHGVSLLIMDVSRFKAEILPLKNKLYRFSLHIVRDEELAKDVVQESLIKVWEKREELGQIQNIEAWCMQITRNKSLDKLRSKHVKKTDLFEVEFDTRKERDTPFVVTERGDLMQRIMELIENLPDRQREVMHLRDIEGYAYKEIAEMLGIDINLVKTNLFRARRKLKESLIKVDAYGL